MRTAAVTTVLVLGLGVGAAGCSADEAEPSALPPVASAGVPTLEPKSGAESGSSTSPTATAGGAPSKRSVPASSPTASAAVEDASAFARRYLSVLTTAFQTADAQPLRALSDPGCGGCNNLIAAVEGAATANERTEGGVFAVVFAEAPAPAGNEAIVELRYIRTAAEIVSATGETVVRLPADPPLDAQMRVQRRGTDWLVLGFRATPK